MNQEQTIALWMRGEDAWNHWADKMQKKRLQLEQEGKWSVEHNETCDFKPLNEITANWLDEAAACFSSANSPHKFKSNVSFSKFKFPGKTDFCNAVFEQQADFQNSHFLHSVNFQKVQFLSSVDFTFTEFDLDADFEHAHFYSGCSFIHVFFKKDVTFIGTTFEDQVSFSVVNFGRCSNFCNTVFKGIALFSGADFGDEVEFLRCKFGDRADFLQATFQEYAEFKKSCFQGEASFENAIFLGNTSFQGAFFADQAEFYGVTFLCDASFENSHFSKLTTFQTVDFLNHASFKSSRVDGLFDLAYSNFLEVPNFNQIHCEEAPLLDEVSICSSTLKKKGYFCGGADTPDFSITANYRSLKRLAIQGHDHRHEVEFFAEELRSKRLLVDKRWSWDWVLSGIFQLTSDYGQSILRPFLFWLLVVGLSATLYLLTAKEAATKIALQCVKGDGWQWTSATQLSIGKGLLFPGIADRTLITQAYDCLYGGAIPTSTSVILGLQTLVSSALLFLILLGIRNRFKLK